MKFVIGIELDVTPGVKKEQIRALVERMLLTSPRGPLPGEIKAICVTAADDTESMLMETESLVEDIAAAEGRTKS